MQTLFNVLNETKDEGEQGNTNKRTQGLVYSLRRRWRAISWNEGPPGFSSFIHLRGGNYSIQRANWHIGSSVL